MADKYQSFKVGIAVISVLLVIGIGLLVLFELRWRSVVNNESALCLTGSCEAPSNACGSAPFKIVEGQTTPECLSSAFNKYIPSTNTSS